MKVLRNGCETHRLNSPPASLTTASWYDANVLCYSMCHAAQAQPSAGGRKQAPHGTREEGLRQDHHRGLRHSQQCQHQLPEQPADS